MLRMHKAYPVTGTVCTGAAARIPGTIVHEAAAPEMRHRPFVRIGHPAGIISIEAAVSLEGSQRVLKRAVVGRTARRIMEGYGFVRQSLFQR